ncbi:MAG: MarR family transcriptional regulator [Actinomycetota bacterium]|nr:MarR family transcriptional regulator [Actinomycetota bacterium]
MSSQVLSTQGLALAAFVRLLRGHAAVTRALSAQLQSEFGLTINDYEALLRLANAEDGRMRRIDLANELVLTASGVTRLLDGLERAGYVAKASCDSDARVTYAVLTDEGRERFAEASRAHVDAIRALFGERFDDEELATLGRLLGRLPGAADADDCAP